MSDNILLRWRQKHKIYSLLPLPKRPAVTEKALTPVVLVIEGANLETGRAMEEMRMPATSRAGPTRVTLRRAAMADILVGRRR